MMKLYGLRTVTIGVLFLLSTSPLMAGGNTETVDRRILADTEARAAEADRVADENRSLMEEIMRKQEEVEAEQQELLTKLFDAMPTVIQGDSAQVLRELESQFEEVYETMEAKNEAAAIRIETMTEELELLMAQVYQPSEVMVFSSEIDDSSLNLDGAQASLAGPDAIYLTSVMYDGQSYSMLLKYAGGTTLKVEAIFGQSGKLIPDFVGLSQTRLAYVAPRTIAISNVEIHGVGYSGTLQYAGDGSLKVTSIRRETLLPSAQAQADALRAELDAAYSTLDMVQAEAKAARADPENARAHLNRIQAEIDNLKDGRD